MILRENEWSSVEKQRIALWDNIKYILIFLVVVGHVVDQYPDSGMFRSIYVFVYAFHMPLFFFISGMFHKNEAVAQRVCTFLALGYVYKFVLFSVRSFMKEEVEFRFLSESGTPWFMFALAIFILMSYWLRDMNQGFVLIIMLLAACFVGYDQSVGSKFVLSRIVHFYPYYVLGEIVNGQKLWEITRNRRVRIFGAAVLILWFLACFAYRETLYSWCDIFKGMKMKNEALFQEQILIQMGCFLIAVIVGFALMCVVPSGRVPILTKFGKRTLQVYFWHRPILYILVDLHVVEKMCATTAGQWIYLLLSIPFTLLLSLRIFSFPTSQILWFGKEKQSAVQQQGCEREHL